MRKFLLLIYTLVVLVFINPNRTLSFENNSEPHKVLKTSKMIKPFPQFQSIKNAQHNLSTRLNSSEPKLISNGTIIKSGSDSEKDVIIETSTDISLLVKSPENTLRFMKGKLGDKKKFNSLNISKIKTFKNYKITHTTHPDVSAALGWLSASSEYLGLKTSQSEFVVKNHYKDEKGNRHIKLNHFYKGIEVWAEEIIVHIDKNDIIYAVNGRYKQTPSKITRTDFELEANQALEISIDFLKKLNKWKSINSSVKNQVNIPDPSIEKVIWHDDDNEPHLAWCVDIYSNIFDRYYIFISAIDGKVLHSYLNRCSAGFMNGSGTDANGINQSFRTYENDGKHYMLSDINNLRISESNLPDDPAGGALVIDFNYQSTGDDNLSLLHVVSTNPNSWSDPTAVSAMWNMGVCNEYFKNTHNRNGIDDNNSTMISFINVNEDNEPMENAFWNGRAMFYGNGGTYFKPLAGALDVAAHELTHGVTEYTANLIYQNQPGALNESMSDIFGAMVDRDDWFMGEDIMQPGRGIALRDLENPANQSIFSKQPAHMNDFVVTNEDNGGVHINSGIPNRAAYLIANSIGRSKTELIYYQALSNYLTRESEFIDCRYAVEQAALDLYGSVEKEAVSNAFNQVGISGTSSGDDDDVNPVQGGSEWITFIREDLQIGLYDIENKVDYYIPDVRVKGRDNNWSQITATKDGNYLYFINENGMVGVLDVSQIPTALQYSYSIYDNVYIQNSGDLWNVAVAPDHSMFAFTSSYLNDNNIYFYIDNQIYSLECVLPSTQEGITTNTIQYADVLDWSPNSNELKLAFDAYNEYEIVGIQNRGWWSMGELEFGDELRMYSLLPPQPDGVSAGNVEYSSTDPDVIAFNYIDADNNWDIKIFNYDNPSENMWITFPDRDVERPSFSPNDKELVVNRTTDGKLLMLDIDAFTYTVLSDISVFARYPEWLVIGGIVNQVKDESDLAELSFTLSQNYPNPFNPSTLINYAIPEQSHVRLKVFDVLGREITTLINKEQPQGQYEVEFDASNLTSGIYFYRMQVEQYVMTKKMILMK